MTREQMKQFANSFCCATCSPNNMFECDSFKTSKIMLVFYLIGCVLASITGVALMAINEGELTWNNLFTFSLVGLVASFLSWGLVAVGVVFVFLPALCPNTMNKAIWRSRKKNGQSLPIINLDEEH